MLRMRGVTKSFGDVRALDRVDFDLDEREIHGLLGENGAGKTTLMNVLYGLYRPDGGEVVLDGEPVAISAPRDAIAHGIGMVHQKFLQVASYSVTENVVLGTRVARRRSGIDLRGAEERVRELATSFGLDVDPRAIVEDLPVGARQRVEILKALYRKVRILILDEPTSSLTPQEVDGLFRSLKTMVSEGMSIVFITHKIREVLEVCDHMTVLRGGRKITTLDRTEASEERLARAMIGEATVPAVAGADHVAEHQATPQPTPEELAGPPVLAVHDLDVAGESGTVLAGCSLVVRPGEVLGVAGVAGNGQRQLAEAVVGILPPLRGRIELQGRDVTKATPRARLALGVAYVPEERHFEGILPSSSVAENLVLGQHRSPRFRRGWLLSRRAVEAEAQRVIEEFRIRTPGPGAPGGQLSGGNIQRVLLGRALASQPVLLVAHNPTQGLDIGSVKFAHSRIRDCATRGAATLLLSEDLDEVMALSHRIVVMFRGRIVGLLEPHEFDRYEIGRLMGGLVERR
jgi:general nucleoside transport system ATP-binding protein